MVYHDATLERLHSSELAIAEHPYATLADAAPLPRLAEILDLFHADCRPIVEVKLPTLEHFDRLAATLRDAAARFPVAVIGRGEEMPSALAEALPEVAVFLYQRDWGEALRRRDEVDGFDLWGSGIDRRHARERIAELQTPSARTGRPREVLVWTVNDRQIAADWWAAGVDGIITDVPWLLNSEVPPPARGNTPEGNTSQ